MHLFLEEKNCVALLNKVSSLLSQYTIINKKYTSYSLPRKSKKQYNVQNFHKNKHTKTKPSRYVILRFYSTVTFDMVSVYNFLSTILESCLIVYLILAANIAKTISPIT